MKRELGRILNITGLALCVVFGIAVASQAQNREKYVISAKAGGINLVNGNVTVRREGSDSKLPLSSNDSLESVDSVTTGADSRVEVLLNPGSYLRAYENTEFELTDASLDNLRVKLVKGSIIVEASSADGVKLAIGINTPQTDALIVKGGLYRFNILPDGTTEIVVRKGLVLYGRGAREEAKGGQKVFIGHGRVGVAKVDKKDLDALDLWSKDRAEFLARANRQLQPRPLLSAFNNYNWDSWDNRGWSSLMSGYRNTGYWVYNPRLGHNCFLPGDGRRWSSPYGHHYPIAVGFNGSDRDWPRENGSQPRNGTSSGGGAYGNGVTVTTGGNSGGGQSSAPVNTPPPTPSPRISEPPAERVKGREYIQQP